MQRGGCGAVGAGVNHRGIAIEANGHFGRLMLSLRLWRRGSGCWLETDREEQAAT